MERYQSCYSTYINENENYKNKQNDKDNFLMNSSCVIKELIVNNIQIRPQFIRKFQCSR
jgi:hypothetical protein